MTLSHHTEMPVGYILPYSEKEGVYLVYYLMNPCKGFFHARQTAD
jgi:hypothetical protein